MLRASVSSSSASIAMRDRAPQAMTFTTALLDAWRSLTKDLIDPYRPERHYMRGPGPKWHAKHSGEPDSWIGLQAHSRLIEERCQGEATACRPPAHTEDGGTRSSVGS